MWFLFLLLLLLLSLLSFLKVLFLEEMTADPVGTLSGVFDFVGVDLLDEEEGKKVCGSPEGGPCRSGWFRAFRAVFAFKPAGGGGGGGGGDGSVGRRASLLVFELFCLCSSYSLPAI